MNTDEKSLVVRQANQLIEASYKIPSVGEGRLIRMLIAQISPDDEDFKTYRIAVADFAKFFGLTGGSAYDLIKKAADELTSRKIKFEYGKSWLYINWLSSAEYREGSGYVELRFDGKLKPFLLRLQTHWKQYALENIINFRSSYSIRIFELLKVEEFKANRTGYFSREFEYEELRLILGVDKKEYEFFKDFRVKVIEIAVREINENRDINVSRVEYRKTGRKFTNIVFHCERPRQLQLNVDEPPPKFEEVAKENEKPEDVRELIAMGIDEATAYKWRKKYGVNRLNRNLAYTRAMQKAGKIRDSLTGFLARAIADNLGSTWEDEEKQRRDSLKEKSKLEEQKRKDEEDLIEEKTKNRSLIMQTFQELTPEKQEEARQAYFDQTSGVIRSVWEKAVQATPSAPETDKRVVVAFLTFFSKWRDGVGNEL